MSSRGEEQEGKFEKWNQPIRDLIKLTLGPQSLFCTTPVKPSLGRLQPASLLKVSGTTRRNEL